MDLPSSSLPIYNHAEALLEALKTHRVIVVEGATGTGKTTQLPRILMHAGLAPQRIGVTQPRRIAAVSVAARIAQLEECILGEEVGYTIRFDDTTTHKTRIKIMTDGILLQEARTDPLLSQYSVVIIDEAHERSLNIDFALGLLYQVLQQRSDLKVIVSSATLNPEQFQDFFEPVNKAPVPKISVEHRVYPIDTLYKPIRNHNLDFAEEVAKAVAALHTPSHKGHILVFLPGEGLIHQVENALQDFLRAAHTAVVLPIYGRLTREEQERVFETFDNKRKIILATNIAETSITIPDVNFVVDTGLAKMPWYNARTGVTLLKETHISQASAAQRAGRAGRTGPGVVVRLYTQEMLQNQPLFSPEEIVRVDLSEAVLRLIDLGIHEVEQFPFPTRPPAKQLAAAITTLTTMGAIDHKRHLTDIGKKMVPFPLSPSLARMVVEAHTRFPESLHDVLLIGAFLSVRSPFLFPQGHEFEARTMHRQLAKPSGDAETALYTYSLWNKNKDKTSFCERCYLDADTMAFIHKAHGQLVDIATTHGAPVSPTPGNIEHILQCIAAGFADKIMIQRGYTYETLQRFRASIHPSSALHDNNPPRFVVACELMQSTRPYAFQVSALKPAWVATANPQAALAWKLQQTPRTSASVAVVNTYPDTLNLGPFTLPVHKEEAKPYVVLSAEEHLPRLTPHTPLTWPHHPKKWRAVLQTKGLTYARGSLRSILAQCHHIPVPSQENKAPEHIPYGALLEPDRNIHTLEECTPHILKPVFTPQKNSIRFVALVSNNNEGFWFEAMYDYSEALQASTQACSDLIDALPYSSDFKTFLQTTLQSLVQKLPTKQQLSADDG
jgi:ATP-dependent helicase HrpA